MSSKSPPPVRVVKEQTIPTRYLADGRVFIPLPELSEKENESIETLRKLILEACKSRNIDERYATPEDYDYLRFLRARKWNVDEAFKMMINALEWRNENKPDLVTEAEVEPENRKGKVYFQDYDYDGRLIAWIKVRLHKSGDSDFEVMKKLCMYWMEQGFRHIRPDAPSTCVLFDMSKFGMANMDYKYVKYIIDLFANYYPDTLGIAAIVNSPWIFNGCWFMIKPWVDPVTASKIKFLDPKELLQIIPKTCLPVDLGGESTFDFAASYVPVSQRTNTSPSSTVLSDSSTMMENLEIKPSTDKSVDTSSLVASESESLDTSNSSKKSDSKKKKKKKEGVSASAPVSHSTSTSNSLQPTPVIERTSKEI